MDFLLVFQDGFTPLFIASQCNHLKVIELLLGAGANMDLANNVRKQEANVNLATNVRKQHAKLRTVAAYKLATTPSRAMFSYVYPYNTSKLFFALQCCSE